MLQTALYFGILSYIVFFLGLIHKLRIEYVIPALGICTVLYMATIRRELVGLFVTIKKTLTLKPSETVILILLLLQIGVDSIGVLGPELGFDALWYHLTIPKIFIIENNISYIPGNLLYYSTFPKLAEMLYLIPLLFSFEIGAKLIHFTFGILIIPVLYNLSRLFLPRRYSFFVLAVYFGNLVLHWEAISAYIELAWTFYSVLSLYFLVSYLKEKRPSRLYSAGICMGFAISVKTLAVISLILSVIVLLVYMKRNFVRLFKFIAIAVLIPLPWFIASYVQTGNPFYPLFTDMLSEYGKGYSNPVQIIRDTITLFVRAPDPLSPLYVIMLPIIILLFKRYKRLERVILLYVSIGLVFWIIVPRTGGSRFFVPYLPAASILVVIALSHLKSKLLQKYVYTVILLTLMVSLGYRFIANIKFIPVLIGRESKQQFLMQNLNFNYGDFYDENNTIQQIVGKNTVLLIDLHNLYYVDFPFVHTSWAEDKVRYPYILTQYRTLPASYKNYRKVYSNKKTHVILYKDEK